MDSGEIFFEKFALFLLVDVNQQAPHLGWRGLKKMTHRKSILQGSKRILPKIFLKNSHYFSQSPKTNRLRTQEAGPKKGRRGLKKRTPRKSIINSSKRILVKKFLKNSHYFYLSNETNRLRPSILLVGAKPKKQEQVCSENTCGPAYRVLFF